MELPPIQVLKEPRDLRVLMDLLCGQELKVFRDSQEPRVLLEQP
jgi:hypothetical protein